MSPRRLPMQLPRELADLTPDVPAGVFDGQFPRACELLDRYVGRLAVELAGALGIGPGEVADASELVTRRGWSESGRLAIAWLLETLELYGMADRSAGGWLVAPAGDGPTAASIRAEAVAAFPAAEPAYEVMELCAKGLPAVLRGETRGEDVLFGPATMGLWFDYFSNSNPHYAPNNLLTAVAVARTAPQQARILEVGGGGGSAAVATIEALVAAGRPPAAYTFTELQPAFLRRGGRALQQAVPAGCTLRTARYDIEKEPAEQGMAGERFDIIMTVNTLHLAEDLVSALARLRGLLADGGALVLGELVRPTPDAAVHLELPFTLLEAYRRVSIEPGIRRRPGFISAAGWGEAIRRAGFAAASILPQAIERCAALYPGFYAGVITARRA